MGNRTIFGVAQSGEGTGPAGPAGPAGADGADGADGATTVAALTDVDMTDASLEDGWVLLYASADGKWYASTASGLFVGAVGLDNASQELQR